MSPTPSRKEPQADAGPDIIYGTHPVEAALRNPNRKPLALWGTRNALNRLQTLNIPLSPVIIHPKDLDRRLGADAVHQGILLEASPLPQPRLDQISREGTVVVLDQITDPHNVGAIFRSCAAFGVTALVTTARHSPESSGVLFKAASGAAEFVPFVKVTNLARALDELKSYGFYVAGLEGSAERTIEEAGLAPPLALVLGAEGKGLRRLTRETCDSLFRLDLPGPIKSLNVSNACALALHAVRGRKPAAAAKR